MSKIETLERRLFALRSNDQIATVKFKDGSVRQMPLPDVIPMLVYPMVDTVAEVDGEPSKLLEIVQELVKGEDYAD